MPTPANPSQGKHPYMIDAENAAEMARLTKQDRLLTHAMEGLFPERADLAQVGRVLDIACGPGGWALDVARAYPHMQVVGIDISRLMVEFAQSEALAHGLHNASFSVMDALGPLDFPADSFDLVNARTIVGFMPTGAWPGLIRECLRITRAGGSLRLTEWELTLTSSPAFERLNALAAHAMQLAGQTFASDGRHIGITPVLGRLLRGGGYARAQHRAYAIEFSAGTEAHEGFYQNYRVAFRLLQPFLLKMQLATQEEAEGLYQQMLLEMRQDDFWAMAYLLTAWGTRPL